MILGATWGLARHRQLAHATAGRAHADVVELRCDAPTELREARMRARAAAGVDASDAGPAIARALAADADPWPTARTVDTTGDLAGSVAAARPSLDSGTAS